MATALQRVMLGMMAAFLALALTTGYWALARSDELIGRDDNPRFVIAEARIRRGAILDRQGAVLAETRGEVGDFTRAYLLPEAAPVVGYATLRYGVAGIEEALDPVLRGDRDPASPEALWEAGVLGRPQVGRAVRLTLDGDLQRAAAAALGQQTGAIVALDPVTGEVLAMVSSPRFDPNRLEDEWDSLIDDPRAPLLNRATFGSYQPGGALQPVLLAVALERGLAAPEEAFVGGARPFAWPDGQLACAAEPVAPLTLAAAFAAACPAPFVEVGLRFSPAELENALAAFGLFDAPQFSLPAVASPRAPIPDSQSDRELAAAGQGDLRASPLQMALAAAAFANRGLLPPLQIVAAVQDADGAWVAQPPLGRSRAAISVSAAQAVAALFPISSGGEVAGHASSALTGPQAEPLAWYLAFGPAADPRIAVAVLVENASPDRAQEIGNQVLLGALSP